MPPFHVLPPPRDAHVPSTTRRGAPVEPVVLVPDTRAALGWGGVALAAVAVSAWLVVGAGVEGTGALLLAASALVAGVLLRQAVAPRASAVVLDARGVRGWQVLRHVEVPTLHGAELGTWLGDPVVRVRDAAGVKRTFLLPVGSDPARVAALLRALAERRRPAGSRTVDAA